MYASIYACIHLSFYLYKYIYIYIYIRAGLRHRLGMPPAARPDEEVIVVVVFDQELGGPLDECDEEGRRHPPVWDLVFLGGSYRCGRL